MEWIKLEYGNYPENICLFRFEHEGKLLKALGWIEYDENKKDWMFHIKEETHFTIVSVVSLLNVGSPIYYIEMDKVEEEPAHD